MGVIKKIGTIVPVLTFSDESLNSIGISEPPTPPSESEGFVTRDSRFAPQRRNPTLLIQRLEQSTRKRAGARKTRREGNARLLQTLAEEEGDTTCFKDPTIRDFRPNSQTPLTSLMTDFSSMRVWQYFLSQSEEEQKKYLDSVDERRHLKMNVINFGVSFTQLTHEDNQSTTNEADNKQAYALEKKPLVHPSYSAEQRFAFVTANLKNILKKKQISLGMLSHLEADVLEVFCKDNTAVYVSPYLSSYERLLLHGICQYNLLKSWSLTVGGSRCTKVENLYRYFDCPETSLTQFIEKRNNLRVDVKTWSEL